jgi:beta-glucanase (GH16 family)
MRWWRPALGVVIVLAIGIWDVGLPGKHAPRTRPGAASVAAASSGTVAATANPGVMHPAGAPEFSATFTGSRLNTSIWATCYPTMDLRTGCRNFGNPEYEWYLPSQDRVYGGVLHLIARRTPTAGKTPNGSPEQYACRSGMVTTYPRLRFMYGYLQVVARIPAASGLWPALWLAAADLKWPPEMDMLESWGPTPWAAAFFHPVGARPIERRISPKLAAGWHTFALSWTRRTLRWLVDGKVILTVRQRIPHQRMYFIANLAEFRQASPGRCDGSLLIRSVKLWKY